MNTNKVTNNFHLLNAEFNQRLSNDFDINFPLGMQYYSAEEITDFCINKCNEARIEENQKWINLIEGRQKSHAETGEPIEHVIRKILLSSLNVPTTYAEIMQAINNRPDLDCIKKGNLKYRIRVLDGTEERISTEGESEWCNCPEDKVIDFVRYCGNCNKRFNPEGE
jgi:hypothetical protein